jgi:glucose-6-phosphate 1-dehydrogenase
MKVNNISLVIFGGTGDLTRRKLIPAISGLVKDGLLSKHSTIVGLGKDDLDDLGYKQFLIDSTNKDEEKRHLSDIDLRYVSDDLSKSGFLSKLDNVLRGVENEGDKERIYYLAATNRIYSNVLKEFANGKMNGDKKSKVVFEKPFGFNMDSARKIEAESKRIFDEDKIFVIDHYLGKEIIQNIVFLKFMNPFFDGVLNNNFVDNIELIIDEDLGVRNRIGFYDGIGAIKDILQNHLLQAISLVLMDNPERFDSQSVHHEKFRVLRSLEVLPSENHLLGQYKSYDEEVRKLGLENSRTETFAKVVLNCRNSRWNGVKIKMRTGKKLENKYAQININFKMPLLEHGISGLKGNRITMHLQPKEYVEMLINNKVAGNKMSVDSPGFNFFKEYAINPNPSDGHRRLLGDVILGDRSLFPTFEEIYESWRIVDEVDRMREYIKFVVYDDYSDPELLAKKFS